MPVVLSESRRQQLRQKCRRMAILMIQHLLLIEDDPMIGRGLVRALSDEGIRVEWCQDAGSGEAILEQGQPALALLDLGLPDKSGMDVLIRARKQYPDLPILIITARDDVDDRVAGLEAGADDYVIKPFGMKELLARIRAVLRRVDQPDNHVLTNGEITLNTLTHEASYRNRTVVLPAREFSLLQFLTTNPGKIFSRDQIEQRLYEWNRDVSNNALDVLIYSLRKKFDNEIIRNVRGIGWMVLKHPHQIH